MAAITYKVQRGDSLWKICASKEWGPKIAGNTINAKIDTLVKLNGIKNRNLIITGQILTLSSSGGSSTASTSSTPTADWRQVSNIKMGLQSANDTSSKNRAVYADWSYTRTNLGKFKYRWTQYVNGGWVIGNEGETTSYEDIYCYSTYSADANATKVRFRVIPIAADQKYTDKDGKEQTKPYWTDGKWSNDVEYDFANNPPLTPPTPKVEIDDTMSTAKTVKLTASISNIDPKELDATQVKFEVVQNNNYSLRTSDPVRIVTASNYVSWQTFVLPGYTYIVRAKSVNAKGKESGWSDFSDEMGTIPSAPSLIDDNCRRNKRTDGTISAFLEWKAVTTAEQYTVEYVTIKSDFDTAPGNIRTVTTDDARTSIEITDIEAGHEYFFRVRAVNAQGESDPSNIVAIPIGSPPAAPTTWSSASSAFAGENMELNWVHNPTDNSKQSFAELSLKINNGGWKSYVFENTTDVNTTGERIDTHSFTYGAAISYKGTLYVKMDTNHVDLKNAKIQWKVRTAGVTDLFSDTAWSVERTIYIYEKPDLLLSMTSDLAGSGTLITTLTSFPFYIRGTVSLSDYTIQRPVGYHLRIVANEFYITADDAGRTKVINAGDAVYSKYFDTSDTLIVEMSADNLDLESGITYTVYCSADMSTGLTVSNQHDFGVSWTDVEYSLNADVVVNNDAYTALITPRCVERVPVIIGEGDDAYTIYEDGAPVEDVTISVYRREYDGTYKEICSGIPNDGTAVTDPHPALDYARYRLVAKDTKTGAISFYDMPGCPVNGSAVILQWDEEWTTFDTSEETSVEGPPWSGSLLKLPYNIKITDNRKRDVTLVEFAGREHPVTFYGTQIGETSTWNVEIPADDKETVYALRRLSLWTGDVYVREPSGTGYWANVNVSFNKDYDSVKIPITLNITRVEGGV